MSVLEARNIFKRYNTIEVLKGVDISIQKGEIVSIVGSSGAGKSTLLHILGTLEKADKGEVIISEKNITQLSGKHLADFRNKYIGFVFQFHHLLPEFSAIENVCIPGWIANTKKNGCKRKSKTIIAIIRIE